LNRVAAAAESVTLDKNRHYGADMRLAIVALAALVSACSKAPAPDNATQATPDKSVSSSSVPGLAPLWIAQGFSEPEGVALSPDGAYFISNISGDDVAKDGAGWISKVSTDGAIIAPRFIDGLNAPKGMAVHDGFLYVADVDEVRTFDAVSAAAGAVIPIPGAVFLNDATVWKNEIYVSDSGTGRIWRLSAEGPVVWREGDEFKGVNGLLGDKDRLLISTMTSGSLIEATAAGETRIIAKDMIDADGIGLVPSELGGGYLVSAWPGEIYYVSVGGKVTSLRNTREAGVLQNDLTTFGDIVIVPNWVPGTVTAWRLTK
jgi:hypothetical protein